MHKVIFEVRALTPLFLAGADQTRAELRAPTIRGLLRYWQRALIGGIVGTDVEGFAYVQQAESATFGSANRGSTISIKVSLPSQSAVEFTEKISIKQGEKWLATGRGYLLWSMARSGRREKGNFKAARWYFPTGTSFQVTLAARGTTGLQLKQASVAFWLLIQLGGMGSRSRRCAGSLSIETVHTTLADLPVLLSEQAQHASMLKQQLEQGIKTAREMYDIEVHSISEARFDILAPGVCRICIVQERQPWRSEENAIQTIGERLQEYRNRISMEQRKIFGLPLPRIAPDRRRASPLHLHISRLRDSSYVGVVVLFKTIDDDIDIKDYTVIEQWINAFPERLEVQL